MILSLSAFLFSFIFVCLQRSQLRDNDYGAKEFTILEDENESRMHLDF